VQIWKTAWRNVWRSRRRTFVTVSAMSFALWAMILYSGLMNWYLHDMETTILDLEVGDVQIHAPEYRDDPSLYSRIDDAESLVADLRAAGYRVTERLLAYGMAAAEESSAGVAFFGVDVAHDAEVSRVHEHLLAGRWLEPGDLQGVVLGRRLARMLGVELGAELVVLSQGSDGAMAADLYDVRGVLQNIGASVDRAGIFMNAEAFRELFVLPIGVHQIVVRRPTGTELDVAAEAVRVAASGLDVRTWRELMPTLASLLDSARAALVMMIVIVYIAIAVLILNAMLMSVFERIRELGVLKALGVGPGGILGLMFAEALIVTTVAIAVGVALGVPTLYYLATEGIELTSLTGMSIMGVAMSPVWRAEMSLASFGVPIAVLVFIVVLAVIYPALKAAFIDPVEAIHHH
jgi:ABC-type lipoprotein release transport system permease subunit